VKLNHYYYLIISVLLVIIIFKYGISSSTIDLEESNQNLSCKEYKYERRILGEAYVKTWYRKDGNVKKVIIAEVVPTTADRGKDMYFVFFDKDGNEFDSISREWDNYYSDNLRPNEINTISTDPIHPDVFKKIEDIKVIEGTEDKICVLYKTAREEIIENNCIIKNTPQMDRYDIDRDLLNSIEDFCTRISANPSIFQYINYYLF
tara:strand:+ start:444 stop:1058 length:615 start_codon:yes stop_codon:yes gene_type:complete